MDSRALSNAAVVATIPVLAVGFGATVSLTDHYAGWPLRLGALALALAAPTYVIWVTWRDTVRALKFLIVVAPIATMDQAIALAMGGWTWGGGLRVKVIV